MTTARTHLFVRSALVLAFTFVWACTPKPATTPAPAPAPVGPETASAPQPAPERHYPDLPPPTTPKPVNFPEPATFVLGNGLTVYVVENHEVPLVSAQLAVRCGKMDSEFLADFSAQMLGEGTTSRTKATIDEAIEFVGGSLAAAANVHVTYLASFALKKDLKLALTLMADETMNPTFPPESLGKLKQLTKTQLNLTKSDPQALARTLFHHVAYPHGHPYGRLFPTEAQIDAVTLEMVEQFHATFYSANNAFLVVAGDVTAEAVKPLVERTFGRWRSVAADQLPPNPLNQFKTYELPKEPVVHLVDRPGSTQAEVVIGNLALARNHHDWVALQVANDILGDDASGRLFTDIREKRGLTYGINSNVSEAQAPGTFVVATRTRTEATGEMLAAIFEHIQRIRNEAPTPEELGAAKAKIIGRFPLELETANEIAAKVRDVLVFNLPADYWTTYRDQLAAVTGEQVHEAARKYIHPVPHIVVVGEASKIEPQIKAVLPTAKIVAYNAELQAQPPG